MTANYFVTIIRRECLLTWRNPVEWINPLLFFVLVSLLFPLTTSPSSQFLKNIGPGAIWVGILLAVMLSLNKLFQRDYEDGSLEQWLISPFPLSLLVSAKIIAHWIMICIPVLIVTPLIAIFFQLSFSVTKILLLTELLGCPLLILLGGVAVALTVSLRQGGLLLALIALPLYIPPLIFATGAINAAASGFSSAAPISWLAALLSLLVILGPWVIAQILRIGVIYK